MIELLQTWIANFHMIMAMQPLPETTEASLAVLPAAALIAMAAAGAMMGGMKAKREQEVESSDRKLASETARYSPWTKMNPQAIRPAGSMFGNVIGGGLGGLTSGMSMGMAGGGGGEVEEPPPAFARRSRFSSSASPWDGM